MLLRASFFLMAFVFISGCAHYTLMEPGTYSLDDVFSVETDTQWSSSKYANGEMWTKNGISLERIFLLKVFMTAHRFLHRRECLLLQPGSQDHLLEKI